MRRPKTYAALKRARLMLLAVGALIGGLLGQPAQAQSFYETGRPFYLGMGNSHTDVPGASVDLPTGAVRVRFPLLALPGRVHHQVAWYFNSQDASRGPLGTGTSLSTSVFMTVPPGGVGFDLLAPGHRAFHFEYNYTDGAYEDSRDPELLGAKFVAGSPPPSGTLTLKNGDQELFDNYGNLYQLQDRYNNFLSIDAGSGFTRAISAGGIYYPRADFTYTNGQVSQITYTYYSSPPAPRAWSVGYDGSARISTVTDPMGGVWQYTWTTYTRSDSKVLPLIATIVTPRGKTVFSALYDSSGRISQYTAADGGVTKFSYSGALGSDGTTTVTDPLSHARQWSYTWPAAPANETALFGYRLTSFKDALGRLTQYAATQPGSNLITQITDYRGRITTQAFDNNGNLTTRTTPTATGGTATTTWTYTSVYSVNTSVTDPLGRSSSATVDPATGNITDTYDANGNHTHYVYNTQGDLTEVTDPLNETRDLYYNAGYGMVSSITGGSGTLWQATYDNDARKVSETDANNKTTYYAWDALDRLTSVTRYLGSQAVTTSFGYDADSNRTSLTDPNNHTWQWTFDPMDRTAQELNPLSQTIGYAWDQAGNLQTRTDGLNQQWVFSYDAENRPLTETLKYASGSTESTVSYSYDATTHLLASVTDGLFGTTSWTYDSLDRPVTESGPYGLLTFTLNPAIDRRDGLQAASQGAITYGHDNNDNVTSIAQNGLTTSIAYDGLNRPSVRTLPSGANTTWAYNPNGFISSVIARQNGSIFDIHNYTRDGTGNITQETDDGQTFNYTYDDLARLATGNDLTTSYSWQYDLAGNRTQQIAGGVTTSYSYNSADQLTAVNSAAVSTDANGNVTQDETGGVYSWDVRGRLKGLTRNGVTSLFGYNPDDLRTSKTVNGTQTTYLLDGESVVQEKRSGVATDLLQGPGIDNLLERGGIWQTPNALGSPAITLDGNGNGLQSYFYAPFGQITVWGSGAPLPYQFTGREADESGLMYYRARYYNPNGGRFVSRDPLGVGGLADGAMDASVRDQVRLEDARQPGAPGAVVRDWCAAGSPVQQGDLARVWNRGVRVTGSAWTLNSYAYAEDNPTNVTDPRGANPLFEFALRWHKIIKIAWMIITGGKWPDPPTPGTPDGGGVIVVQPGGRSPGSGGSSGGGSGGGGGAGNGGSGGSSADGGGVVGAGGDGAGGGGGEPPIGPGTGGCFVASTPVVMADGTTRPIAAVKVGDMVMSRDPATMQTKGQRVHGTTVRVVRGSIVLRLSSGERVETTYGHPFYVPGKGFVIAGKLAKGTLVARWKGAPLKITGIGVNWTASRTVYNLRITNFHTYFVGRSGIWVHNRKADGEPEPE